jgi:hypothetical protein
MGALGSRNSGQTRPVAPELVASLFSMRLSRRGWSHFTPSPGHAAAGARNRAISIRISFEHRPKYRDHGHLKRDAAAIG